MVLFKPITSVEHIDIIIIALPRFPPSYPHNMPLFAHFLTRASFTVWII